MKHNRTTPIRLLVLLAMLVVMLGPVQIAYAATCTSLLDGLWDASGMWSCTTPVNGDDIVIATNVTLNISGFNANKLTIYTDKTLTLNQNLTVSGSSGDVLDLSGNIDLNGMTLTLTGNGGNIKVSGANRTISGGANSKFAIGNTSYTGTKTVTSASSGTLTFGSSVLVEISGPSNGATSINFGSSLTTINGSLQIDSGGLVSSNGPTYGDSSTLIYNTAGVANFNVGPEWAAGSSGVGVPNNVHLTTNSTNIQMMEDTYRWVRGTLTLDSNTSFSLPPLCDPLPTEGRCGLGIKGDWINDGATFNYNVNDIDPSVQSYVDFEGSSPQIIGGGSATAFYFLRINNSSGVSLGHTISVDSILIMDTGRLHLEKYNLTLARDATIAITDEGTDKMIVARMDPYSSDIGRLCKIFTGSLTTPSFIFYIGDDTDGVDYTPVDVHLSTGTYSSYNLCITVADVRHPKIGSNITTDYLTRYWQLTAPASKNLTATFSYVPGDVVGNESNIYSARWLPPPQSPSGYWTIYDEWPVNGGADTFSVTTLAMKASADYTGLPLGPTAVSIAALQALPEAGQVRVQWTTGQEVDLSGFTVYRATTTNESDRSPISPFIDSQAGGTADGADYEFPDTTAQAGVTYYYWIEAVGTDGNSTFFGSEKAAWYHNLYLSILLK